MSSARARLTVLNSMAGKELGPSLDQHVAWGLELLDLKDCLFGKRVEHLTLREAEQVALAVQGRGLRVHTLSSCLLGGDIEQGEDVFRRENGRHLDNLLQVAQVLRPTQIRLLAASSSRRASMLDSSVYLEACHPWVYDVYRESVDRIAAAGLATVIENEVGTCLFSSPHEIHGFFARLDRPGRVSLTWDVQNLWQTGAFPTLAVYESLRPLISMLHLKGGRCDTPGGPLRWASYLEDASWPLLAVVRAALRDGVSPVICLNPSHGEPSPDYTHEYRRDIEFLRAHIPEIE